MVEDAVLRRRHGSEVVEAPLFDGMGVVDFDGLTPWRVFRSCRGQAHYSGLYWSAVMGRHVGYESRLELAWLLLEDRDPRWRLLVSQPFQLVAMVEGRVRRHVPDFLAVRDDGLVTVVDVKPRRRLQDPKVAFTFSWTRQLMEQRGWGFEVFSEPDPVLLSNVRFLSGYRRRWQFDDGLLDRLVRILAEAQPLEQVEDEMTAEKGDRAKVRGHLLHLLWSGRVRCALGCPLRESLLLEAS